MLNSKKGHLWMEHFAKYLKKKKVSTETSASIKNWDVKEFNAFDMTLFELPLKKTKV